jgi:hypothetical protein
MAKGIALWHSVGGISVRRALAAELGLFIGSGCEKKCCKEMLQ